MNLRTLAAIIVALLVLLLPAGALANSGPVRWESYAHGELMAVQEDCPIEVQHETLEFDLTPGTDGWHTLGGTVTATYTMRNPTNTAQHVEMAFPLVAELHRFSPAKVQVRVGEEAVVPRLYIGQAYSAGQSPDNPALPDYSFAGILAALQPEGYAPQRVDLAQEVLVYSFLASKTGAQDVNLTILFPAVQNAYFFGGESIRGYGQEGDDLHFLLSTGAQEVVGEVLVIGDAPAPQVSGTLMDDTRQPTDAYSCAVTQRTETLEEYLRAYCARMAQQQLPAGYLGNAQAMDALYSLCLRRLDAGMGEAFPVLNDSLEQAFTGSYLLALQYAADFPAQSTLEISIRYPVSSAMHRQNSEEPLYPFTYLFSPAAHWASFGGLSITLKTPEEAPFILDSSLPFTEDGARVYTAHATGLPEAPFSFTLYSNGTYAATSQAAGATSEATGANTRALVAGILAVGAICIASVVLLSRKGRAKDDEA